MADILARGLAASAIPSPYLGAVSCRFMMPDSINAGVASMMIRRADFTRDDIVGGWFVFPDFYVANPGTGATADVDTAPGSARTITASIEYPIGVPNQILFGGSATLTTTPGTARNISDYMAISIPRNSQIWFNTRQASASGIIYSGTTGSYGALGDMMTIGSNVTDQTMAAGSGAAGWSGTAGGNPYGPLFIAMTRKGSLVIVGDSREAGFGNTSNSVPYPGGLMPGIAPFLACANLARGSATVQAAASGTNFSKRAEYLQYFSHGCLTTLTNDVANGRTVVQILADRQTIIAKGPGLTWLGATSFPKTTSSDSWATVANQTLDANSAVKIAANDIIRAGEPGFSGFFELADAAESARNSGKLKAPSQVASAITTDGNHLVNAGYALMAPYVNPGRVSRLPRGWS